MTTPEPLPRPRAILLDAMGTLITLRRSVGHTYAELASRHAISVDADRIDEAFPQVLRQAPPLAFTGLAGDALLAAERRWWGDRIDTVLQAVGAPAAPVSLHHDLFDHFADPAVWRAYDDVADHLRRWHGMGIRMAVVSNFDRRLPVLLDALGLGAWIDRVVVSSEAGAAKPSPEPFRQALASLEVRADEAWHVGDSPEDAEGAWAAGVTCLTIRRP